MGADTSVRTLATVASVTSVQPGRAARVRVTVPRCQKWLQQVGDARGGDPRATLTFHRLHSVDGSSEMATSAGRATATTPLLGTAARDDRRRYCGGRLSRGACVGLAATVSVTLGLMFGSLLGLFVVAPHVVKARASSATIDFKSIAMSNPNKSSVDVHVDFSIDTHSVFSAFVAATDIDVLVGGKTLGTFSLPASKLQSSSPTVMHLASTLVVDPSGPFFSFAQSLLTEEHVEWTLRSHLKLTPSVPIVGNLSDVEVDLEKVVKLRGFSGLHPVVSSFTFANSSTATDVIADVVVTIDNPTVFTFDPIGELSLDVKAGKSMVGNASTPVWSLFPGKNVGMRVKAHVFGTDENHEVLQAIVGELVHGRDIELSASSVTTSLSLYNPALANTTMNLTLPGSGEPIGIIQNISTNELTTWAVDDEHAALAGQLDMRLTDALLGPLCHVSLVSVLDATLEVWSVTASSPEDPVLVGTLHVPWAPASPGSDPFSFRLQLLNASTTLPDGAAPFRDFFMLVASVSGPIGHVKVAGNARASVITPIGKFTVRDINFDVPVVIRGADGFPSDTDSWRIFDGADGSLGIIASLTVTNPSNCALRLGDSELSIADGIDDEERYGVMPLSDFTISTGINTYSNVSGTLNVSSAAQKDQVSSLLSSVVAGSQDASATFQVVKFATGSKAAWANDIFKELAFIVSPPIDGHASPIRSMRFGKQAPTFTFVHGESTNASAKLSGVHVVVELHVPKWVEADLQISGIQSLTFTVNDKKVDVVKKDCQASHVGSRYDIDVNLSEVNFDMSLSPSEVFASERVTVKSSISSPSFTSRRGLTISLPDSSTASSLVVAGLSHLEDSQSTCIVGDSGRISSDGSLFFKSEVLLPTSRSRDHPAIYEFGEMQLALTSGAKLVFDNLRFGQSETQTAWITLTPKQLVSVIGHKGVIDRTGHDGFVPLTVSVTAPRFASFLSSVEGKLSDLQNYRNATHVPISISVCNPLSNVNLDLRIVGDGGISLNGIHLLTWSGSFLASASGTNCLVVHIDDTNVASRDESTWTSLLNSLKSGPARVALRGTFNTIFKDKQADRHVAIPIVLTHTATNLAAH